MTSPILGSLRAILGHAISHKLGGEDELQDSQGNPLIGVPVGGVIGWDSSDPVPDGWAICDGTNGTPDLRGSFIRAAGGAVALGSTGGNNSFTHSSQGSHQHDTIDLQHAHSMPNFPGLGFTGGASNPVIGSNTGITLLLHALHVADGGHTHDAHALPLYYAMYLIKRVK